MRSLCLNLVVVLSIVLSAIFNVVPVANAQSYDLATGSGPSETQPAQLKPSRSAFELPGLRAQARNDARGSGPSETQPAQPWQGLFLPVMYESWQTREPQAAAPTLSSQQINQAATAGGAMFIENVGQFDPGALQGLRQRRHAVPGR